jgi:hypothetical protein
MDQEIERLVIAVRADTQGFARDVDALRGLLDGPLADGFDRVGDHLQGALSRAIRRGSLDFDDLRSVALGVVNDIASAAIQSGLGQLFGGGANSGLVGLGTSIVSALLGLPGRATGGPVTGGRAFVVGERGPEIFVPTSSGRIETLGQGPGQAAPVMRVTINVSDNGNGSAPQQLQRSGRQIARLMQAAVTGGAR